MFFSRKIIVPARDSPTVQRSVTIRAMFEQSGERT